MELVVVVVVGGGGGGVVVVVVAVAGYGYFKTSQQIQDPTEKETIQCLASKFPSLDPLKSSCVEDTEKCFSFRRYPFSIVKHESVGGRAITCKTLGLLSLVFELLHPCSFCSKKFW